ncbi:hypothetical protein [Allonocardiopsis opalescens]|uniref:hypothetical protein n=1 Tax=Allonocardiopsis opalescens TaxID=1144618 RepID=UPI000D048A88|nr:hypothetical protein [Allonocardiopsis opalescens]
MARAPAFRAPLAPHRTVDGFARRVVTRCAPGEAPYYERLRDVFLARRGPLPPVPAPRPSAAGGIAVGLVTGVLLAVLDDLVTRSAAGAGRPPWRRALARARRALRLADGTRPDTPLPELTPAQGATLAATAAAHALASGLPEECAAALADAVLAELGGAAADRRYGEVRPAPPR